MEWTTSANVMLGAVIAVGAAFFLYQLYHIIVLDARTRGLKHPRIWGLLSLGNNTGGGLFLYLARRRNSPAIRITEKDRAEILRRKKATGIGLAFAAFGTVGLLLGQMPG